MPRNKKVKNFLLHDGRQQFKFLIGHKVKLPPLCSCRYFRLAVTHPNSKRFLMLLNISVVKNFSPAICVSKYSTLNLHRKIRICWHCKQISGTQFLHSHFPRTRSARPLYFHGHTIIFIHIVYLFSKCVKKKNSNPSKINTKTLKFN